MKAKLAPILLLFVLCGCVSIQQTANDSLLWDSVTRGDMDRVKKSIEIGADVNGRDENGQTALMLAIRRHRIKMATYFVENGADLDIRDVNGRTALMIAAEEDLFDMMELLIDKGADMQIKTT